VRFRFHFHIQRQTKCKRSFEERSHINCLKYYSLNLILTSAYGNNEEIVSVAYFYLFGERMRGKRELKLEER
jgi:hypothetical protein